MKAFKWSLFVTVVILDALSVVIICRAIYVRQDETIGELALVPLNSSALLIKSEVAVRTESQGEVISVSDKDEVKRNENVSLPVRLIIPKLAVDTDIDQVGLTAVGAVAVPTDPNKAAWFEPGPIPGEAGNAVIVGHSGWYDKRPAVFDELGKLRKGDRLYVMNEKGQTDIYLVRKSQSFKEGEDRLEVFGPGDGKVHLNLITCSGAWNKTTQDYDTRLVVFTDKVN